MSELLKGYGIALKMAEDVHDKIIENMETVKHSEKIEQPWDTDSLRKYLKTKDERTKRMIIRVCNRAYSVGLYDGSGAVRSTLRRLSMVGLIAAVEETE